MSRPALSNLPNGKAGLPGEKALRIEKAFGVRMDTLMRMQSAFDIARTRSKEKEILGPARINHGPRRASSGAGVLRLWARISESPGRRGPNTFHSASPSEGSAGLIVASRCGCAGIIAQIRLRGFHFAR